jgi:hypothetical protein
MKRTLIRYKTKPDMADRNAELIAAVFAELKATNPEGLRYLSLRLDDDSFVHLVESESDSACCRPWLLSRRSRAEFVSVASSRRSPEVLQSLAIIGCSPNHRHCFRKRNAIVSKSAGRCRRH